MNIINPNEALNSIKILPRSFDENIDVRILLKNEDTNFVIDTLSISSRYIGNELDLTINYNPFVENQRYELTVKQGDDVIFRGLAFVTEFNDINYTINNNEFAIDIDTDSDEMKVYE
jgi:hypothetical protein